MWYAAMAQLVEHILGKDEVPGPNPGSSSRQPRRETFGALVFYKAFAGDSCGSAFLFWGCLELLLSLRTWLCGLPQNPVRIPREEASSLLVRVERGYLRFSEYPGSSRHSRCGSVTLEVKQLSTVFLHSRAAMLPQR